MTSLDLTRVQKQLWKLITAPESPLKTLSAMAKKRLPIVPGRHLKPEERLDIYANMYFFRILEALKEDFPNIVKTIGDARFHNLITDYLVKHPSRHFSLRMIGQHFSDFLKNHPFSKKWPYLPDMAALEWAILDVFDAANANPLSLEQLKSLPPERWAALQLGLVPAHAFLSLRYRVDVNPLKPQKKKTELLVWRKGFKVFHRPLQSLEFKLLSRLAKGSTLEKLGSIAARELGTQRGGVQLAGIFNRWLEDQTLTDR